MASLNSILILGPDTVAAASPATPVQLVHACRRWGFSSVVPASWGDELIAGYVIRRCATRENRPVIQCSCPRVSERLATNATMLEDSILWLVSPPVAVAKYLRALEDGRDVHITYAGGCPGATDPSIDQRISATELLLAISARGIDIAAQPTVFEDIIPPDPRRHFSSAGGFPEPQHLWETAAFRVSHPAEGDLTVGIAQLLLAEERLLIDLSPAMGCICRSSGIAGAEGTTAPLRAPSPIVLEGKIDVGRSAPAPIRTQLAESPSPDRSPHVHGEPREPPPAPRQSPARPAYRRQSTWRRQSPRPGVIVARPSAVMMAVSDDVPLIRRPEARLIITALIVATSLMLGLWIGRRTAPSSSGSVGVKAPANSAPTTQIGRSRSP